MKPLRIIFAGTPEFGLPCLEALASLEHQLVAIYTQPDRKAGRGQKLQASPIKQWALQHDIPVYQPQHFKEASALETLKALQPDLMIVIAYGLILPQKVLDIPRLGCINVHASLLPRWRGASPIQRAIWNGDKKSGITIMQLDAGMDTGPILTSAEYTLKPIDTAQTLHDELAKLAVVPLLQGIKQLINGSPSPIPQTHELATYAPKITKEEAKINWQHTAQAIEQQIRALNPWPIAFTTFEGEPMRIYQAKALSMKPSAAAGTVLNITPLGMDIATSDGILRIEKIQFPGGKVIAIADWMNAKRGALPMGLILI